MNFKDYLLTVGKKPFSIKKVTDLDFAIFSLLSYVDFKNYDKEETIASFF